VRQPGEEVRGLGNLLERSQKRKKPEAKAKKKSSAAHSIPPSEAICDTSGWRSLGEKGAVIERA